MDTPRQHLAELLRGGRNTSGLSLRAAAERLTNKMGDSYSYSALASYESGKSLPSPGVVMELVKLYDMPEKDCRLAEALRGAIPNNTRGAA
jgi:transcriptional regulator with XRE-family HTH domain